MTNIITSPFRGQPLPRVPSLTVYDVRAKWAPPNEWAKRSYYINIKYEIDRDILVDYRFAVCVLIELIQKETDSFINAILSSVDILLLFFLRNSLSATFDSLLRTSEHEWYSRRKKTAGLKISGSIWAASLSPAIQYRDHCTVRLPELTNGRIKRFSVDETITLVPFEPSRWPLVSIVLRSMAKFIVVCRYGYWSYFTHNFRRFAQRNPAGGSKVSQHEDFWKSGL